MLCNSILPTFLNFMTSLHEYIFSMPFAFLLLQVDSFQKDVNTSWGIHEVLLRNGLPTRSYSSYKCHLHHAYSHYEMVLINPSSFCDLKRVFFFVLWWEMIIFPYDFYSVLLWWYPFTRMIAGLALVRSNTKGGGIDDQSTMSKFCEFYCTIFSFF